MNVEFSVAAAPGISIAATGGRANALLRQWRMSENYLSANSPNLACRSGCAACCIAPSISSLNKAAGVPCAHLDGEYRCRIFGKAERPACCAGLQPSVEMCGESREYALNWLADLELLTHPG